ncbi:MAG: aldo/keto reductase [Sedimentisphaerales bacterium]|jgi:predicted oxidoreductase|nr:aldo/keto reductase [Sedimentisphaerales bacterium]NLT76498.1 oxidoreductase [Planctomycetota bacterium]
MVPQIDLCENGPRCSRIVHGLWRLADWSKGEAEVRELITGCLEVGITTFDHADIYGDYTCESLFGRALVDTGIDRSQIQLVTKCGIKLVSRNRPGHAIKCYDTTAAHIVASAENSLKNLRVDYIDLLLIHRPDPLMDPAQVNEAFLQLKSTGKVRHFGVSNFLPSQFEMLASKLDVPLVTNQIEYSVMHLDAHSDGSLDLCQRLDLRPMAWSPMGGGRLFHEDSDRARRLRDVLGRIGRRLGGASMDQVALAWLLVHPARLVPVIGTGRLSRIHKAVEALELTVPHDEWFEIWCASTGRDVP